MIMSSTPGTTIPFRRSTLAGRSGFAPGTRWWKCSAHRRASALRCTRAGPVSTGIAPPPTCGRSTGAFWSVPVRRQGPPTIRNGFSCKAAGIGTEALDAVGSGYVFGARLLSPPADLPDKGFDTKAYGPLVSSDTYLYAARHAEGGIPGGRSGLLVGRRWRF